MDLIFSGLAWQHNLIHFVPKQCVFLEAFIDREIKDGLVKMPIEIKISVFNAEKPFIFRVGQDVGAKILVLSCRLLTPMSDQDRISPYNTNTISTR